MSAWEVWWQSATKRREWVKPYEADNIELGRRVAVSFMWHGLDGRS
jgi:protoheme ferro-lyase